jgi:hypothetical protein
MAAVLLVVRVDVLALSRLWARLPCGAHLCIAARMLGQPRAYRRRHRIVTTRLLHPCLVTLGTKFPTALVIQREPGSAVAADTRFSAVHFP